MNPNNKKAKPKNDGHDQERIAKAEAKRERKRQKLKRQGEQDND